MTVIVMLPVLLMLSVAVNQVEYLVVITIHMQIVQTRFQNAHQVLTIRGVRTLLVNGLLVSETVMPETIPKTLVLLTLLQPQTLFAMTVMVLAQLVMVV